MGFTGRCPRYLRSDPSPRTLLHRIGYGRLLLRLRDVARKAQPSPEIDWLLESDLAAGIRAEAPIHERVKLFEAFTSDDGRTFTCRPDAGCWLRVPGSLNAEIRDLLFYVEYDRGYDQGDDSETIREVSAKVPGYYHLIHRKAYRRHWPHLTDPNPIVRVLFVTTASEARLGHLAQAIGGKPGSHAWRLTTEAEVLAPDFSLFKEIWRTVTGERKSILRATRNEGMSEHDDRSKS